MILDLLDNVLLQVVEAVVAATGASVAVAGVVEVVGVGSGEVAGVGGGKPPNQPTRLFITFSSPSCLGSNHRHHQIGVINLFDHCSVLVQ